MSNRIAIATLRGQLRLIGAGMTIRGLSKTKALDVAGNSDWSFVSAHA